MTNDDILAGLNRGADDTRAHVRRARRIAHDFEANDNYERLLRMRDEDRDAWRQLGNATHIACGLYEQQRQVAADLSQRGNEDT